MAWNTEETRAKLLAAGTAEFAEFGLAGGRIDRIAAGAGVNKERIYQYFGNKDGLFEAVIGEALGGLIAAVPFRAESDGVAAFENFAGRLFDHFVERPVVARLLCWEGLERGGAVADVARRLEACQRRIDLIAETIPGLRRADAADLLLSATTLGAAWIALPQVAELMADGATSTPRRRDAVAASMRAAAEAASAAGSGRAARAATTPSR